MIFKTLYPRGYPERKGEKTGNVRFKNQITAESKQSEVEFYDSVSPMSTALLI